jgi:hypothetical protein
LRSLTRDSKIKAQSMPQASRQSKLPDPPPRANSEPRRIVLLADHPQGANLDASYFFPIIHRVRTWTHSSPGATLLRDFRRPSSKSEALTKSSLVSSETLLQNPSLIRLWIEAMLHHIYHLSLGKDIVIIYAGNCRRWLMLNYCCSGRNRMQQLLVLFK